MTNPHVIMRQMTSNLWQIENEKGNVLQRDIKACTADEASKYVSNWISSFPNWTFELILSDIPVNLYKD